MCISKIFNAAQRKKIRCLGVLTFFKQGLISLIRFIIIIMEILVKDNTYFPKEILIKPFQEAAFLIYYPMK